MDGARRGHWMSGLAAFLLLGPLPCRGEDVVIHPAPPGEPLSALYTVTVDGRDCPVLSARVAPADPERRWLAMDDKKNSADYFDVAAFASFDMARPVEVAVTVPDPIGDARLLPTSLGLEARIEGKTVSFRLERPAPVTVEVNGRWVEALHVFANPPETDPPGPGDPGLVYFGPGVHEVTHREIGDDATVYLAPGALVRAVVGEDEPFSISTYSGQKNYSPTFALRGRNIRFRGRGILDGSALPTHARHPISVADCADVDIEGIIVRDAPIWTIPIRRSERVRVRNVKLIGYRANSDGIDICNSRDVSVEGCFLRTLDDLVVVKADKGDGPTRGVRVERCVLWNEVAHALSVGAEIREDVADVIFRDCDVIRDKGREWTLRVYHADGATVAGIRFEALRIEESRRLASVWIGKAVWSRDAERGRVRDVLFSDIDAVGDPLLVELVGFDAEHAVEGVTFCDVTRNGRPLTDGDVRRNAFVRGVRVQP
jgi:hypothetical protein